jgi:hypothetical protein
MNEFFHTLNNYQALLAVLVNEAGNGYSRGTRFSILPPP